LGLIRSWGAINNNKDFLVIPDNLMNLELLEWSAQHGTPEHGEIARSHARVTARKHYRADAGGYHVLDYGQTSGAVKRYLPGQGLSTTSAWARGQSWSVYGFTMMYRFTRQPEFLEQAQRCADFALDNPNMPEDGIPYWDYGAPGEERDSSAGAILASALLELSQFVEAPRKAKYQAFAVKELLALSSPAYFSEGDEIGHFLLKHGVGHKPAHSEIDTPLNYGDYYFLEALLRFRNLGEE